jgi:xanthine dehydrogenase accessory factor
MEEELIAAICEIRQRGQQAALVTIVETKGSTPRKAGSKMLVYADGRTLGSIGGGCAEADAKVKALQTIDQNRSSLYQLSLLNDIAADEGMVCGGIMDIFIQVL